MHVVHIVMQQTDSFYADLYLYGRSLLYVGFDWKKNYEWKNWKHKKFALADKKYDVLLFVLNTYGLQDSILLKKTYCSVPWVINCKKMKQEVHVHASIRKFSTENLAFSSIWFFENTAFSAIQYMRFDVRFFGHCFKKYVKDSPCYRQVYHTAASFPCTCMQILELYVEGTYDKIYT